VRLFPLLLLALFATPAGAKTLHQEGCIECHGVGDFWTRDPVNGREYNLNIDVDLYRLSSHGQLLCKACHERGYHRVPHPSPRRRDPFQCLFCHRNDGALEDVETRRASVEKSVHFDKVGKFFDCHACHDPHRFQPRPDQGRNRVEWANAICMRCHGDAGGKVPFDDAKPAKEAHNFLPQRALHLRTTECASCHGDHVTTATGHAVLPVEDSRNECRSCHAKEAELLRPVFGNGAGDNSDILKDVYVIGATRTAWLDQLSLWIVALLVAGLGLHGVLRFVLLRGRP
jgi:hypothetical protein